MTDKSTQPEETPQTPPPEATPAEAAAANGATPPEATNEPEPPASFQLTKEERLTLENIQLRSQLLQQQQASLGLEQKKWGDDVATAHGVDISKYNIHLQSGQCDLVQVGEPKDPAGGDS